MSYPYGTLTTLSIAFMAVLAGITFWASSKGAADSRVRKYLSPAAYTMILVIVVDAWITTQQTIDKLQPLTARFEHTVATNVAEKYRDDKTPETISLNYGGKVAAITAERDAFLEETGRLGLLVEWKTNDKECWYRGIYLNTTTFMAFLGVWLLDVLGILGTRLFRARSAHPTVSFKMNRLNPGA